jgi:hypothetical protein
MSYMAQRLGAKELHSFFAYSLIPYDYAYDTKEDNLFADSFQDHLVHYMLMSKLNTYRMRRRYKLFRKNNVRLKYYSIYDFIWSRIGGVATEGEALACLCSSSKLLW